MEKQHTEKCPVFEWRGKKESTICPDCICDGYHTFDELYEHRITLFIALCRYLSGMWQEKYIGAENEETIPEIWRSKLHSDGSSFDGWFILGINKEKGEQITYHLPLSKWEDTDFAEPLEKAPEFDGHTSDDVLERIKDL
jgi:hypothetical protein